MSCGVTSGYESSPPPNAQVGTLLIIGETDLDIYLIPSVSISTQPNPGYNPIKYNPENKKEYQGADQ